MLLLRAASRVRCTLLGPREAQLSRPRGPARHRGRAGAAGHVLSHGQRGTSRGCARSKAPGKHSPGAWGVGSDKQGDPAGPVAGVAPVEGQQQRPQWGEEGLLDAGQAAVLGDGRVQAFESQEGQREQPVCWGRAAHGAVGPAGGPWMSPRRAPPPSLLPHPPRAGPGAAGATASTLAQRRRGICLALPLPPFTPAPPTVHAAQAQDQSWGLGPHPWAVTGSCPASLRGGGGPPGQEC